MDHVVLFACAMQGGRAGVRPRCVGHPTIAPHIVEEQVMCVRESRVSLPPSAHVRASSARGAGQTQAPECARASSLPRSGLALILVRR